jgi:uncharacterized protein
MKNVISKYVYFFISTQNEHLIYCSRTNSFLKVSAGLYDYLSECGKDNLWIDEFDDELIELLKNNKIIVNENEDNDYLLELQYSEDENSYNRYGLGLVIAPTLSCNFDCPYCFELGKRANTITDKVIDNLIAFINKHTEAKALDITWYGGEPLVAFEKIKKIYEKIQTESFIPLIAQSIITNGYLFNQEVCNFFKDKKLNSIQITLDGNRERHNSLRKLKVSGAPTFDSIIENIDYIVTELPDTHISIRVNVEKSNLQDFFDLQKELSERWKNKKIDIYPGILRLENEDNTNLSCDSLSKWEEQELFYNLNNKGIYDDTVYPQLFRTRNCCATRINSYIIGPKGEIYKCWNDVSNDDRIIGYINEEKLTNSTLFYRYIVGTKWYHNEECKKCFFLPICHGNCAWYRLRNQYDNGKYNLCQCMQSAPDMLNRCLEQFYYVEQKKETTNA